MRQDATLDRYQTGNTSRTNRTSKTFVGPRSKDIHVRSYDHRWGYDLHIQVGNSDGTLAFEDRYYVQPGETFSASTPLPAGEYVVTVVMDNDDRLRKRCALGERPAETAVIEVGNGVLSCTGGLQD